MGVLQLRTCSSCGSLGFFTELVCLQTEKTAHVRFTVPLLRESLVFNHAWSWAIGGSVKTPRRPTLLHVPAQMFASVRGRRYVVLDIIARRTHATLTHAGITSASSTTPSSAFVCLRAERAMPACPLRSPSPMRKSAHAEELVRPSIRCWARGVASRW